jgi:RNA polymerase sigma-70 factor (ECF subfamily)
MQAESRHAATLVGSGDNELMKRVAGADQAAFTELYNRWAGKIRYFFLRLYGYDYDTADDRTQDTFLKVLEHAKKFDADQNFSPWLYAIACNLYKNDMRRRKLDQHFREAAIAETSVVMPAADRKMEIQSSVKLVHQYLEKLDPEVKTIFLLRHAGELTIPEIARATGCPEGTVKSRLFYAMKKMSENLQPHTINEWI